MISAQIGKLREQGHESQEQELSRLYRPLNNLWHTHLHRIARSTGVMQTVEVQRDLSDYFVAHAGRPIFGERLATAHAEHEQILEAVINGDSQRAAAIIRTHVLTISDRFRTAAPA